MREEATTTTTTMTSARTTTTGEWRCCACCRGMEVLHARASSCSDGVVVGAALLGHGSLVTAAGAVVDD
jgi:hypothetical protein